jgi:hypothetical protein
MLWSIENKKDAPRQGIGKSKNSFQVRQQFGNKNAFLDNQQHMHQLARQYSLTWGQENN